jgi:enoyl-CoA hydratase/carnithine racemase
MPKFKAGPVAFKDYASDYPHIALTRDDDGILVVRLHDGQDGPANWPAHHDELTEAFYDITRDVATKAVIVTGTGESFMQTIDFPENPGNRGLPADAFIGIDSEGHRLLYNMLNIPVPMIAAINGPANVFGFMPVMCDIVLATPDAVFGDTPHYENGLVPGDGAHVVWSMLLGPSRARYFLLTGERIGAEEAKRLGFVHEIEPRDTLLDRAHALARQITAGPPMTVRMTRQVLTQDLRRRMHADLPFGMAAELLAGTAYWPSGRKP